MKGAVQRFLVYAALGLLAGCGGSVAGSSVPHAAATDGISRAAGGWLAPEATIGHRIIYVADGDQILLFPDRDHNPAAIGSIRDGVSGANGLCVDRWHDLYVVNQVTKTVTVYPPGHLSPSMTYTGLNSPVYPAVDHDGNLYVSNNNFAVTEYRRGHPMPYRTLSIAGNGDGIALDKSGNLYVAYRTGYYSGGIEEFAAGSTQGRITGIPLVQSQGLLVTADGTIVAVQTGRADGVYVYRNPKGRSNLLVKAIKIDVQQTPVEVAITQAEHKLFVSAFGWTGQGHVYVAGYPTQQSAIEAKIFHSRVAMVRRGPNRRYSIQGMALSDGEAF